MAVVTFERDIAGNETVIAIAALNDNYIKFRGESDAIRATIEVDDGTIQKMFTISPDSNKDFYFNTKEAIKSFFPISVDDFEYDGDQIDSPRLIKNINLNITVIHESSANSTGTTSGKFIKSKIKPPVSIFFKQEKALTEKLIHFEGYPIEISVLKSNGELIRYNKEVEQPIDFIVRMKDITTFQSLYNVSTLSDTVQYSNGVWLDNGVASKDTVLISGQAPSIVSNWKNGKNAIEFTGTESLRIAEAADNYNTLNSRQSIFLVGEYDEEDGDIAKFIEAELFEIIKAEGDLAPLYRRNSTTNPFLVRSSFRNSPFVISIFTFESENSNLVFVYVNGDFIAKFDFISRSFVDVFIGNSNLNGKIASIGFTENEENSATFKQITKTVNNEYGFDYSGDNQVVFIGDSLTVGATISAFENRWTYNLITDLETLYSETFRYLDTSRSGIRVLNYDADEFDDNLCFVNEHDINNRILFIWLGSNDFAPFGIDPVDDTTMLDNMLYFIENRLKAGFKKIAVATVIDRIDFGTTGNATDQQVDDYNAALKAYDFSSLETQYGAAIEVVNLHDLTELQDASNTTYFDADEVHINATGAALVKTAMQSAYNTLRGVTIGNDTSTPTIESVMVDNSNQFIDITFSKGVFADPESYSELSISNFEVTDFIGAGSSAMSIDSIEAIDTNVFVGNDKRVRLNVSHTGTPDGNESFTITTNSLYDVFGNLLVDKSAVTNLIGTHPDLQAVLNAATLAGETLPSSADINNLDILIKDLEALEVGGVSAWSLIDRMLCWATDGDQDFNLRQIKNANNSSINNGATFNQGQDFDGVTGYIDTNIDLSTLTNYQRENSSIILYLRTNNVNQCDFGVRDASGNSTQSFPNVTSPNSFLMQDQVAVGFPVNDMREVGTIHYNLRSVGGGNSEKEIYTNGVFDEGVTTTPTIVPPGNVHAFGRNNNGTNDANCTNNISLMLFGGDLSDYTVGVHTAIDKFMTAQGINV